MVELPDGTVTFLLADVEGSTALWEQAPEVMRTALARHDVLFEQAVREHGGVHIRPRGEGDSRFAVFTSAPNAVSATLTIQRTFASEGWPTPRPIRVRIGLHTGEAQLRDADYYGSAVNRCARLRAIGHGGQTLLSEVTAALVRDDLPAGASLVDMGSHRLKDLIRPERVSQVVVPDLQSEFPSLASLDGRPNNLPLQTTVLLGRERDVAAARERVLREDVRLLTLTGPGGTGKTRLGLQVAAEVIDQFEDGVFFVGLASISDPQLVVGTIAQTLEIHDMGGRPVLASLTEYLRHRQLLLVLDNFEQILSAAPMLSDLLGACPRLTLLVTSRAPLELRGEHEFPVRPLTLPDRMRLPRIDALSQYGAVALFIERATAIRPDFSVTNENAPAVAEICHRLDGLPLAIELAAARIRLLNPQVMLARLDHRLPLLTGGARDLPVRQQTLRGAIAWSYDLLDTGEQVLFRRLAVFVGGCTLEAAEAVCDVDADLGIDVLDGIASLVTKSLLRQDEAPDGQLRFGMLETIREYASDQLDASGELLSLRDRHLDYCLAFAEAAEAQLRGPRQVEWFDRLERENDNLRAALEWSATEIDSSTRAIVDSRRAASRVETGIRLADALEFFWVLRGLGHENLPRVMVLVDLAAPGTIARAQALLVAAHVRGIMLGDYQVALRLAAEAEAIWRALGDTHGIAMSLLRRGMIMYGTGDYQRATAVLTEARAGFLRLGEEVGPENPVASFLAQVARSQGDYDQALAFLHESLADSRARGDGHAVAFALRELAIVRQAQGDFAQAVALLRESLASLVALKDIRCAHDCLERLAALPHERSRPSDVARLFGAAEALRERIGKPLTPGQLSSHDPAVAALEQQLGPESFATAWADGRGMRLEQAITFALEEPMPS